MRNVSWATLSCLLCIVIVSLHLIPQCRCLELETDTPDDEKPATPPSSTYSALVIFGDSYSDNGHNRSSEYQKSLSSAPSFGGRSCDGPVWNEFLVRNLSVDLNLTFLNYAFNGAHIKNSLSNLSYPLPPDIDTQFITYTNDLQKYVADSVSTKVYQARILHFLWIGINPLVAMWRTALTTNQTDDANVSLGPELARKIDAQVEELKNQLTQLLSDRDLSKFDTDFVLMTVPPLHTSRLIQEAASAAAKGNSSLARKYVMLYADMTDHFNIKLVAKANKLKADLRNSARTSRIAVFHTAGLWIEIESNPSMFGIDSLDACFTDSQKPPCTSPNHFMYWDALHPSSILHAHLSNAILSFLDGLGE